MFNAVRGYEKYEKTDKITGLPSSPKVYEARNLNMSERWGKAKEAVSFIFWAPLTGTAHFLLKLYYLNYSDGGDIYFG